ncbi:MAG: hypothetical protein M5U09_13720 [Gammaproteobacteria bacterium]|nr:hypothetical protein [Gammaproteobacteria bacterium]
MTSTAQYLTGALKSKMDEADAERVAFLQAVKEGKPAKVPTIGYRVCRSTAAIGRGLDLEMIRLWHSQMEQSAFERAVLCDLRQPPEGGVRRLRQRARLAARARRRLGLPARADDVHLRRLGHQPPARHPGAVLRRDGRAGAVRGVGAGPPVGGHDRPRHGGHGPALRPGRRGGRPTGRGLVIIGDPTTNPGQSLTNPSKNHILAQEGEGGCCGGSGGSTRHRGPRGSARSTCRCSWCGRC